MGSGIRRRCRPAALIAGLLFLDDYAQAQGRLDTLALDPVSQAMESELLRTHRELERPGRPPPYYVGFWVIDFELVELRGSLGALTVDRRDSGRRIKVELRLGDHRVDNSNFMGPNLEFEVQRPGDDPQPAVQADGTALRREFWLLADTAYRSANELLDQKKAQRASEVEVDELPADFSVEEPRSVAVDRHATLPDRDVLIRTILAASERFLSYPAIHDSEVAVEAWVVRRRFVSSEGVRSYEPSQLTRFSVRGSTQAPDGMPLSHSEEWFGTVTSDALLAQVTRIGSELTSLRDAPLVEDYSGPVLFEGIAAAQITAELLSLSLSGTPGHDGQDTPLARRLGRRVLPSDFSLFDDPTLDSVQGIPLFGGYAFDDEGVIPQRVSLVESGRLKQLLMSRTPRKEFSSSNGHGRSGLSGWAKGGIGNLVMESRRGVSKAALRRRLLATAAEQGLEYGVVVTRLDTRGFSTNGFSPPVPQTAFKLYPDGRIVFVRGAALGEMSVRDLRDIVAASSELSAGHFSTTWPSGLETPSTVVVPSLLFEEVEVKRPKSAHARPPAWPRSAIE